MRLPTLRAVLSGVVLLLSTAIVFGGDWPSYKHDPQRSSATDESPALPLRLAWRYVSAQPPAPAWPDTFKLVNRTDFDYAPHPVVAGGIVCIASTADDTVRALDAKTGVEKWRFTTGGPVRVAPQIDHGRVYFGADDGHAYCLDAGSGEVVWQFRGAPRDERLIGNHRLISRWPIRTGVVVEDGVAYFVAGLWNTEGVFGYALHADSGKVIWCNDLLGFMGVTIVDFPAGDDPMKEQVGGHAGEFAANASIGANPQGPALIGGNLLLIPNGNSGPTFLNKRTGQPDSPSANGLPAGTGGMWLTIDGGTLYAFSKHRPNQLMISPRALDGSATKKPWGAASVPPVPQVSIAPPPEKIANAVHERGKVSAVIRNGKMMARHAYGAALAGGTLYLGLDGAIVAQDPDTERELWRAGVTGEAREIAIADGRAYVGTTTGAIYCFEPAPRGSNATEIVHDPGASIREATAAAGAASPQVAAVVEQLRRAGMDRGFALVLGDVDGQWCTALAGQTQLRLIAPMTDVAAAAALRERLLEKSAHYGSRIHVATVDRLDALPFTPYLANAVVIAGNPPGLSGKELYRLLRPCGGVLLAPGLTPDAAAKLTKDSGALEGEVKPGNDGALVERGKLPGALDWDSLRKGMPLDQRVRWPLRSLWFGGPSTFQAQGGGPIVANGRYIVTGEQSLTAVDAYNGAILWSRPIPRATPGMMMIDGVLRPVLEQATFGRYECARNATANDNFVFLQLASGFFQGYRDELARDIGDAAPAKSSAEGRVKLDARTGAQVAIAAPFNSQPPISLASSQKWKVEIDAKRSGTIEMSASDQGIVLNLTTTDPLVSRFDGWELFFDFRPAEARFGLYERGVFQTRITVAQDKNTPATWRPGNGPTHPALRVAGAHQAGGSRTSVLLTWDELKTLTDSKPTSFGFAVTLNAHDANAGEPITRRHLFCDWTADGINNGWANVFLDKAPPATEAAKRPAIVLESMPERGGGAGGGRDEITAERQELRIHPLTGEPGPKMFRVGGCGGVASAAQVRSGSQSIYDFHDDSGMRPIGGQKVRCSTAEIAALGLLFFSEELGHCVCNYPIRTTQALVPTTDGGLRRLNEDWAFYFDRPIDTVLRTAAINFGAPGDRRDDAGTLWLGFPRLPGDKSRAFPKPAGKQTSVGADGVWLRTMSASLQLPVEIECFPGEAGRVYRPEEDTSTFRGWQSTWAPNRGRNPMGPYRVNADRVEVAGTDRPWLYASGIRGLRRATVRTNFLPALAAPQLAQPPALDGKLAGDAWKGEPQVKLPFTDTTVMLRHDAENLYIAARRTAVVNRHGFVSSWSKSVKERDGAVWQDDAFEVFLADPAEQRVLHLGVSASGAQYDALSKDGQKEDAAWNGQWKSAVMATQSTASLKPGMDAERVGPTNEAMVKIEKAAGKNNSAPGEDPGADLALEGDAKSATTKQAVEEPPLMFEMAVPWKTLETAGIQRGRLAINVQMNQRDISGQPPGSPGRAWNPKDPSSAGEALCYLGVEGRARCRNFAPLGLGAAPALAPRPFTVRLHFAELDDAAPGRRVFDIKLDGRVAAKGVDVVNEAGGPRRALVKEFKQVAVGDALVVEFVPVATTVTPEAAPILCAMELLDEGFQLARK